MGCAPIGFLLSSARGRRDGVERDQLRAGGGRGRCARRDGERVRRAGRRAPAPRRRRQARPGRPATDRRGGPRRGPGHLLRDHPGAPGHRRVPPRRGRGDVAVVRARERAGRPGRLAGGARAQPRPRRRDELPAPRVRPRGADAPPAGALREPRAGQRGPAQPADRARRRGARVRRVRGLPGHRGRAARRPAAAPRSVGHGELGEPARDRGRGPGVRRVRRGGRAGGGARAQRLPPPGHLVRRRGHVR